MTRTIALSVDDLACSELVESDRGSRFAPLARPEVRGEAVLRVAARHGVTRLADLHHRDPLSLRLPAPGRGDILEACIITTSGGIVGGDLGADPGRTHDDGAVLGLQDLDLETLARGLGRHGIPGRRR